MYDKHMSCFQAQYSGRPKSRSGSRSGSRPAKRTRPRPSRTPPRCSTLRAVNAVVRGRHVHESPEEVARLTEANAALVKKIAEMADHLQQYEAEIADSLKKLAAKSQS